jgi:hypothetical protein
MPGACEADMLFTNTVHERSDVMMELEMTDDLFTGDPRRCPRHGTVTSSDDGMFDAPCGTCEAEMDAQWEAERPLRMAEWTEQVQAERGLLVEPTHNDDDDIPF